MYSFWARLPVGRTPSPPTNAFISRRVAASGRSAGSGATGQLVLAVLVGAVDRTPGAVPTAALAPGISSATAANALSSEEPANERLTGRSQPSRRAWPPSSTA